MASFHDLRSMAACLCALALGGSLAHAESNTPAAATTPAAMAVSVPAETAVIESAAPAPTAAEPAPSAPAVSAPSLAAPLPASACNRDQFKLILDVGHSAQSPGADSARGVTEYSFNITLTRQIERQLREAGFSKTAVLITEGRARPSLGTRIRLANKLGGNLFLSIHHDSVPQQFKSKWEFNGRKLGFSDRFRGHSIFISNDNPDRSGSMMFGKLLGAELKSRGMAYTPHYKEKFMGRYQRDLLDAATGVYRYDKLLVLKYTTMPAVLFEAGNIVNREEEIELRSEERQLTIANAVTHAVDGYCSARGTAKPEYIARKLPNLEKVARKSTRHARKSTAGNNNKKAARSRSATLDASTIKRQ